MFDKITGKYIFVQTSVAFVKESNVYVSVGIMKEK